MGKQRRAREKYHLACKRAASGVGENQSDYLERISLKWKVTPDDNPFEGIDIDINGLNKMDMDDDMKSVKSISKSIKGNAKQVGGKLMKKEDKIKLRHSLFIQKIEAVSKKIAEFKKKKIQHKNSDVKDVMMHEIDTSSSKVEFLLNKKPVKIAKKLPVSKKSRGIKKAHQRTIAMLSDLQAFKKALEKSNSTGNPIDLITSTVEDRVFRGII